LLRSLLWEHLTMSRGGRGGWRGGRLGGPGKIAGADVPWAWDPDLKLDYTPSQLYPVRSPWRASTIW
jgi:hypothetical protein